MTSIVGTLAKYRARQRIRRIRAGGRGPALSARHRNGFGRIVGRKPDHLIFRHSVDNRGEPQAENQRPENLPGYHQGHRQRVHNCRLLTSELLPFPGQAYAARLEDVAEANLPRWLAKRRSRLLLQCAVPDEEISDG